MSMYKCAVIDDDQFILEVLKRYIEADTRLDLVGVYDKSFDGALEVTKKKPQILFLDINLPFLDGADILEILETEPHTIIISVSEARRAEFESYDNVVGFIHKPILKEDFDSNVDKAITTIIDQQF